MFQLRSPHRRLVRKYFFIKHTTNEDDLCLLTWEVLIQWLSMWGHYEEYDTDPVIVVKLVKRGQAYEYDILTHCCP